MCWWRWGCCWEDAASLFLLEPAVWWTEDIISITGLSSELHKCLVAILCGLILRSGLHNAHIISFKVQIILNPAMTQQVSNLKGDVFVCNSWCDDCVALTVPCQGQIQEDAGCRLRATIQQLKSLNKRGERWIVSCQWTHDAPMTMVTVMLLWLTLRTLWTAVHPSVPSMLGYGYSLWTSCWEDSIGKAFCNRKATTGITFCFSWLSSFQKRAKVAAVTSKWTAGSRLSTGKSGRPRLEDSWEHSVVARDSSCDTLKYKLQHDVACQEVDFKEFAVPKLFDRFTLFIYRSAAMFGPAVYSNSNWSWKDICIRKAAGTYSSQPLSSTFSLNGKH